MRGKEYADPDAYAADLSGWQLDLVAALRRTVRAAADFDEVIKWGHLVYMTDGPALLIRAEEQRVLFGFWRGQRMLDVEPRLKPGGKYEMATLEFRDGDGIDEDTVRTLASTAARLNTELGDPRNDALRS